MIPQNSPLANYLSLRPAIDAALQRVVHSGRYILGPETAAFEREFAEYIGVGYAVGTGSGTDALHLILRALDIGIGDEIITVSHTAMATVAAIEMCNAVPVFVDIELRSYTMDPLEVERAITPHTRAILPVHLYGQPADLLPLLSLAKEHGLYLIEDCAQAHGAQYHGRKVGSWGDAGAFSFYPTKNLGCLGDGGAITTNDASLHEKLLCLRQYGWDEHRVSRRPGCNSRLDELQAAILRAKLNHLEEKNQNRIRIARTYSESFKDINGLYLPEAIHRTRHVYHQYVVRCSNRSIRDHFMQHFLTQDIQTAIHYPLPVHQQPGSMKRFRSPLSLPVTENVCDTILSLPMFPELDTEQIAMVVHASRAFFDTSH
jgi:dTDP-3-amino-3,4,6-trideoxy-alpha-D-glucose transaminase